MALDTTSLRSRRHMLVGAIGAALAAGATALGRPSQARAADGDPLLLGEPNAAGSDTSLTASGGTKALAVVTTVTDSTAIEASGDAFGTVGLSAGGVGVAGAAGVSTEDLPPPITESTGVYGISLDGTGVYGASNTGAGVYGATHSTTFAAVVGQGNDQTGVHGHAGDVPLPTVPAATGVYGTTNASVADATGVYGLASQETGATRGVLGQVLSTAGSGVVGVSGAVLPAPMGKTGVFGYAAQDVNSRGVFGKTVSGQAIRGEATSGVGVRGYASTTGVAGLFTAPAVALRVEGRAVFTRSGKASVPANAISVDVTVPGGLPSTAFIVATMQEYHAGVAVAGVRLNHPVAGTARIYLTKVASTTTSTPVAWVALG